MNFIKKKLSNGMNVVFERRELPVVSVAIVNKSGGASETSDIKGIAHVIEHMVFTGTETRTHEDISREIEKKGGVLNAFTSNEVTAFWFKLPNEHVFSGLDILVDIIRNPKFDEIKFEKEKKVILEEIKMNHDEPGRDIHDKIFKNMFLPPFGDGIIGFPETVSALKRDFVIDYYKKKYDHSQYIVVVVGNTDIEKIYEYLEKNFPKKEKEDEKFEVKMKNSDSVEERAGIDQAHYMFAMHAPLMTDKDYIVLEVLDAYLASGMSSKLFLEIREERGLAYTVHSSIQSEKEYSYYTIYAGTRKEAIAQIKEIIINEFGKIKDMSEENLREAKERLIGLKKVYSEESSRVMNELIFAELVNGVEDYYNYENSVKKVTLEQVKELANKLIKNYSTAAIVPK